ncbi:MAG: hypothetical protein K0R57_3601 [Paenibacillaceae bacterium]|nr:hypothetical protein [Paenibacillaceae bacterium]
MKQRIITGVVAGGAFIALLVLGGYWFLGLVLLLAIVGYDEYIRMIGLQEQMVPRFLGLAATVMLTVPWEAGRVGFGLSAEVYIWLIMLALLSLTVMTKNKLTIDQAALVFIGIIYMGFGFHYMVSTRWLATDGLFWTLLTFLCIWASDAGAYFAGVAFGKHLLWPAISPKKTVEGSAGGVLLSVAVAVAFSLYNPEALELGRAVLLGAVIAVVGQMGDLIQSAYKRVKGIKDTGAILPGHGGVLDRVDSWLIVFPFLCLLSMIPQ